MLSGLYRKLAQPLSALSSSDNASPGGFLRFVLLPTRLVDLGQLPLKPGLAANRFIGHFLPKGIRH